MFITPSQYNLHMFSIYIKNHNCYLIKFLFDIEMPCFIVLNKTQTFPIACFWTQTPSIAYKTSRATANTNRVPFQSNSNPKTLFKIKTQLNRSHTPWQYSVHFQVPTLLCQPVSAIPTTVPVVSITTLECYLTIVTLIVTNIICSLWVLYVLQS